MGYTSAIPTVVVRINLHVRFRGDSPYRLAFSLSLSGCGSRNLDADVGMAGQWNLVVMFDPNGRCKFGLQGR